jgi:hypothetical protein
MTELWFKSMEDIHACIAAMDSAGLAADEAKWSTPEKSATIPTSLVRSNTV